jgi:hypothetical protein
VLFFDELMFPDQLAWKVFTSAQPFHADGLARVGASPVLRARLSIYSANASANRAAHVHEVGDDDTFSFLQRQFLRQQALADAALDARDLCLDHPAAHSRRCA